MKSELIPLIRYSNLGEKHIVVVVPISSSNHIQQFIAIHASCSCLDAVDINEEC